MCKIVLCVDSLARFQDALCDKARISDSIPNITSYFAPALHTNNLTHMLRIQPKTHVHLIQPKIPMHLIQSNIYICTIKDTHALYTTKYVHMHLIQPVTHVHVTHPPQIQALQSWVNGERIKDHVKTVLAHVHLCHLQLLHSDRRFFIAQIPTTA